MNRIRLFFADSEIGPENTLKVETRVQIPLGLRSQTWRSLPSSGRRQPRTGDSWPD